MAGSCKYGDTLSGTTDVWLLLDWPSNCQAVDRTEKLCALLPHSHLSTYDICTYVQSSACPTTLTVAPEGTA